MGQTIPNLDGEYYFKDNKALLYIFNKNEFLVLGYDTAVKGKIEIVNNNLEFKTDHPDSNFMLYGRNALQKRIIFSGNIFRNNLYFTDNSGKEEVLLNEIKKEDYCRSYCYFLPLEDKKGNFLFKTGQQKNYLTSFKINKNYNEFLLEYLPADADIFFMKYAFKIKNNELLFDSDIEKKPLNMTKDIQYVIGKLNQINLVFNKEKIYLDENFELLLDEKIDLSKYTFNPLKNQYTRKKPSEKLNILYVYSKLKPEVIPNVEYNISPTKKIEAKCLKTPQAILKEEEDKKIKHEPVIVNEDETRY